MVCNSIQLEDRLYSQQELFDLLLTFMRKQGQASYIRYGEGPNRVLCQYRGADNTACGVGCFIPDSLYRTEIEGKSCTDIVSSFGEIAKFFASRNINNALLRNFQKAHDMASKEPNFIIAFNNIMKSIAKQNNLIYKGQNDI